MAAYYNEIDKSAASWLRELIKQGHLPDGEVDERSIVDVQGTDLVGFTQCHFFAGIGGWPYALRLAGWRDEPIWTGSCPCQPFSDAGKRLGERDDRHLWPEFRRLIAERDPPIVFGEQVASKAGRVWLAGVRADLETLGYGVGAADLCAASVGAPHIRQRLFWLADSKHAERREIGLDRQNFINRHDDGRAQAHGQFGACGEVRGLADSDTIVSGQGSPLGRWRDKGSDAFARHGLGGGCELGGLDDANKQGSQGCGKRLNEYTDQQSPWATGEFISCLDGNSRRVEPGICPLAHGVSGRVGRLRGYGNAIVPQLAAEFIKAYQDL